ncbi:MAG: DUF692 domain-containing protein [Candidatus Methylopumilus sp.]
MRQLSTTSVGLGLKRELIPQLQAHDGQTAIAAIEFLEIAPENWIGAGGKAAKQLAWLTEHYPMVAHGLSLSLGGPDPLNMPFLYQIKQFLDRHHISLYTEHLSYCAAEGYLYDLLPMPFTEEAVHHVASRIKQTQEVLERRIAIENAAYYVAAPIAEMDELSFIQAVLDEADCDWHLDVNNLYVNSINFGFDAQQFLQTAADAGLAGRVVYGHIAGHQQEAPDLLIDTHGASVIEPVWDLLAQAYQLFGHFPTLLERDTHIPPLLDLMPEVEQIASLQGLASLQGSASR